MRTLLLLCALALAGCDGAARAKAPEPRFTSEALESVPDGFGTIRVIADRQAGARCYVYHSGNGGGISCLPAPSGAAVEAGR